MTDLYPGATWRPSSIAHPTRSQTLGVIIHWTVGHEAGDIATLDGPNVDCQFYVTTSGRVYQFLDPDSCAWHAFEPANSTCIGIEHEGSGEPYTPAQLKASAKLVAWLCKRYAIPAVHAQPTSGDLASLRGIMGHGDLSAGHVGGPNQTHTDSVPSGTGWTAYLAAVHAELCGQVVEPVDLSKLPGDSTLRLAIGGRYFAGWDNAAGPLRWIDRNGADDPKAAISWQGHVWRGPEKVTGVARHLTAKYLDRKAA